MFDGFKERKSRRVSNQRRFTESIFYIACRDTSAELGGVDTDSEQCETCRLVTYITTQTYVRTYLCVCSISPTHPRQLRQVISANTSHQLYFSFMTNNLYK